MMNGRSSSGVKRVEIFQNNQWRAERLKLEDGVDHDWENLGRKG